MQPWGVPRSAVSPTHPPASADATAALCRELVRLGLGGGLSAVGIATAEPFEDTRADIVERKWRELHGSMQFTYRNPDRSTDPRRILPHARSLVVGAWSYREGDPGDGEAPLSSR